MKENLTAQDWEMLSAYLDGAVTPEEKRLVERRLSTDPDYRSAYLSLSKTRGILRSIPRVKRRKNFFVSADMIRQRGWLWLLPAINFSSAAAAIMAVFLLLANLIPSMGGKTAAMEPGAESVPQMQEMTAKQALEEEGYAASAPEQPESSIVGNVEPSGEIPEMEKASEPELLAVPPQEEMKGTTSDSLQEAGGSTSVDTSTGNVAAEPSFTTDSQMAPAPAVLPENTEKIAPTATLSARSIETARVVEDTPAPQPKLTLAVNGITNESDVTPSTEWMEDPSRPEQTKDQLPGRGTNLSLSGLALTLILFSIILAVTGFILKKVWQ